MIRIIVVIFLSIVILNCAESNKKNNLNEIYFTPDSTLIGDEVNIGDTGYSFNPLNKFIELKTYAREVNKASQNDSLEYVINIFGDLKNKNICFLTKYKFSSKVSDLEIKNIFLEKLKNSEYKYAEFIHNDIQFKQIRIVSEENIKFSLWLNISEEEILKIDYILTQPINEITIKAVETSISTIKKINGGNK